MSDTPQGGWWKAKDGKWYPPETHPDYATIATTDVPSGPPAAGWWQANDGNWYPPETHPDQTAVEDEVVYDLTDNGAVPSASMTVPANGSVNGHAPTPSYSAADYPSIDEPPAAEPPRADLPAYDQPTYDQPAADQPAADLPPADLPAAAPNPFAPIPEPTEPPPSSVPSSGGLFNLTPEDAAVDESPPTSTWGALGGQAAAERPAETTPGGWGTPTAQPETVDPAASPDSGNWGQIEDAVVVETPPHTPTPVPTAGDDPDAPLPGWRKGGDGHWYPPGQEPPAARANVFPAMPRTPEPTGPGGPTGVAAAAAPSGSRRRLPLILGAVAVVALLAVGGFLLFGGGDDPEPTAELAATTTTASTTTEAPASTTTVTVAPVEPPGQASGTGSAVVAVDRTVTEPYLALVTHDGPGSFSMALLDANGNVVQEPMDEPASGDYLGVVPVNFVTGQPFTAVRVEGEGPWAVTFAVVESAPDAATTPGSTYNGKGDQVVRFAVTEETRVALACTNCDPSLSVTAWSGSGAPGERLEIDGGTAVIPADTAYLQVTARGNPALATPNWTLTPT